MKERPILFGGSMVRAILDGRKTQTRRVLKHPVVTRPPYFFSGETRRSLGYPASDGFFWAGFRHKPDWQNVSHPDLLGSASYVKCPYGAPGDRLWVRETWKPHDDAELFTCVKYRADDRCAKPTRWTPEQGAWCEAQSVHPQWRPSIFMPRWASRITLEIIGVRVERLNDISEADAKAEGCDMQPGLTAVGSYSQLWDDINGRGSWATNPWVWIIEFRRIQQ